MEKTVQYTIRYHQKKSIRRSPTFEIFIRQIDGGKFPHKLKGSGQTNNSCGSVFFGRGASMVVSDYNVWFWESNFGLFPYL